MPTNDYPRCRFRGALLGAAIGDGIGAPFEGNWIVNTDRLQQIANSAAPLRYTDDTHMTIGLAEAILERGGFDGAQTAAVFARNYAREPWRGYGAGPPRIFQLMERGVRWDQAAGSLYGGIGSFGNGAAMRVAPVALLARGDLERVADLARQSASVTHTHAEGVDGAILQACAIALLTLQPPGTKLDRSRLLTGLAPYLRTRTFRAIIEQLEELPAGMPPADAARLLGNGIEASRSVPLALYAFLENFGAFPDCVLYAVSAGGDTDTIASMAGALSGAYLGDTAIPSRWAERMEGAADLRRLADELWAMVEGGPGS